MKSHLLDLRNILMLTGVVFQATLYTLLIMQLFADLDVLRRVDYVAIYTGGYIAHYRSLSVLYDMNLQRQVEDALVAPERLSRFYPYNHPPILARVLQWVTTENYTASYVRWVLVLLVFHLASLLTLSRTLTSLNWRGKDVWVVGISGLLFYPIFTAYLKGQDSTFIVLAVSLWTYGLLTGRDRVAGLGLALTALRPQVAIVLALPFLFKRRHVWWWFIVWGIVLLVYSWLLVGTKGMTDLANLLLLSGQGQGIDVDKMPTLMGAIANYFPAITPQALHLVGYGFYILAILFLCVVWFKSRAIEFKHIGLAVLLAIVFSSHLHNHDLSLLFIPALAAAAVLAEYKILSYRDAALLPLGLSVLLMLNGLIPFRPVIYVLMLILGLLLWVPDWLKTNRKERLAC